MKYVSVTDEEEYENVKKLHKKYPKSVISPKEWKKLRLIILKSEGKVWSK